MFGDQFATVQMRVADTTRDQGAEDQYKADRSLGHAIAPETSSIATTCKVPRYRRSLL
jgi:hypothetical protein